MRRYIDEYFDDQSMLLYDYGCIKNVILEIYNNNQSISQIVNYLQDWLYIFDDDEEEEWETQVVENIINGKTVKNRFTGEVIDYGT